MDSASLDDHDVDVVHALEPFGSLEDDDTQHEAMIAEATAAALAASASNTVDVVAVDAAALAAESAANLVDAAGVPVVSMHASSNDRKNEQRRKRYRERVLAEDYNYNEETGETTRRRTPREEGTGGATSSADDSTTGDHSSASRRARDRERYANMTQEERDAYNARRRKQYTQQSDAVRQRRRQRERARYHSMPEDKVKERNAKRARLERERYKKMPKEVLEERNRKRRERAAAARKKKMADVAEAAAITFEDTVTCDFHTNTGEDPTMAGTTGTVDETTTGLLVDDRTAARGLTPQQQQRLHELFPTSQETGEVQTGAIGDNALQDIWKDPADL